MGYSPWGHKELDMTERLHFSSLWTGQSLKMSQRQQPEMQEALQTSYPYSLAESSDGGDLVRDWPGSTHGFRLAVAFVQLQARLALPLFPHIRSQGLPSSHTVSQALKLVPFSTKKQGCMCQNPHAQPHTLALLEDTSRH